MITLRLRGIFAACLAWFFGLALMGLATKMVWLTRGPLGMRVDRLFETQSNVPYYYLCLAMMVAIYIICKWVTRTRMGVAFKAIGQNMEAARTSGINPVFYRVSNFVLSCALGGVLGGFYAHYYGILTPDMMHTSKTVEVLAVAYIGGRGSLWGGAAIAFPFHLRHGTGALVADQPAGAQPAPLRPAADRGDDLLPRRICRVLRHLHSQTQKPDDGLFSQRGPGRCQIKSDIE
jgi:ABC-type branched-subunit amino acid transport system permease subunit